MSCCHPHLTDEGAEAQGVKQHAQMTEPGCKSRPSHWHHAARFLLHTSLPVVLPALKTQPQLLKAMRKAWVTGPNPLSSLIPHHSLMHTLSSSPVEPSGRPCPLLSPPFAPAVLCLELSSFLTNSYLILHVPAQEASPKAWGKCALCRCPLGAPHLLSPWTKPTLVRMRVIHLPALAPPPFTCFSKPSLRAHGMPSLTGDLQGDSSKHSKVFDHTELSSGGDKKPQNTI